MSSPADQHSARPPISQDAALVAALASTAMPFAHSAQDQTESWVRALREHGAVGASLRALGVDQKPLLAGSGRPGDVTGSPAPEGDVVERVLDAAGDFVIARGGETIGTGDLLFGLFEVYGGTVDRALYLRGTTRGELFSQMALDQHEAAAL